MKKKAIAIKSKKKKVIKKKPQSKIIPLVIAAILLIFTIFITSLLLKQQELRSRAADTGIQYIGSTTVSTPWYVQSFTINLPSNYQEGDLLLAVVQSDYGSIGGALPPGWKLITERNEADDLAIHAFYKFATKQEPVNTTWKIVNTTGKYGIGGGTILAFRGVNTTNPIFGSAINPETKDNAFIECPSVATPVGGMLVCGYAHDDPQPDIKLPATMTRVSNFIIKGNDDAHAAGYEKIAAAGQTGVRAASIDKGLPGGNDIGIGIVLNPADPNAPQPPTDSTMPVVAPTASSSSAAPTVDPNMPPPYPTASSSSASPTSANMPAVPTISYCLGGCPTAVPTADPSASTSPTVAPVGTAPAGPSNLMELIMWLLQLLLSLFRP